MTDLYPTLTRRKFLAAVGRGRIVIGPSGTTIWRVDSGWPSRCESRAREQLAAGWIQVGVDGCTYELTETGRAVLDGAR